MSKLSKKCILWILGILWIGCVFQQASAQFAGLPFGDILASYTQYSSIYYHFGGNNFAGMLFLTGTTTIQNGENIFIGSSNTSIKCYYKLNGFYFNNIRWRRLRPLDEASRQTLIAKDTNYNSLTINTDGWLYTNCTGWNTQSNEIYWQITHKWWGIDYIITAGLGFDTNTNNITQPSFYSGSLKIASGSIQWFLYDTYGGIWEVWVVQIVSSTGVVSTIGTSQWSLNGQCDAFKVQTISGTNVSLSCSGRNWMDYILNLFDSKNWSLVYSTNSAIAPASWLLSIATGNYIASCTVNLGNSSCNPIAISNISGQVFTSELGSGQVISNISMVSKITPIRNADVGKPYTSENIIVGGLVAPTLASISKWDMTINSTAVWTTGYVKNGDLINITLTSSKSYNTTISSVLFIGWSVGTFSVITKDNSWVNCSLNQTQKLKIAQMFEFIKAGYNSTPTKRTNMLYVLKSMSEDIQSFDYNCSLQYLTDLTDNEIENWTPEDETAHIAPNCKTYQVVYDDSWATYTSSNFKKRIDFISRDALVKFIDSKNPGDCHLNVYTNQSFNYQDTDTTHAAPNGKVYSISYDGVYYTSPTMSSVKKFDTKEVLLDYIDKYNPEFPVWDHQVDTSRTPVTYAAPNNKEYKIYKTDKWYMSYSLVGIKYFDSEDEIIEYIDKNNK